VALSVPTRLLKLFAASGVLTPPALAKLVGEADLPGVVARQAGQLADMDFIAHAVTLGSAA